MTELLEVRLVTKHVDETHRQHASVNKKKVNILLVLTLLLLSRFLFSVLFLQLTLDTAISFMKENVGLWTGLCAVSGLNFADLPPKQQLEMMKPMSTKRYKKARVTSLFLPRPPPPPKKRKK